MSRVGWTVARVREPGVTTDLITAGSVLGIGRTTAYQLYLTPRKQDVDRQAVRVLPDLIEEAGRYISRR
jgi:hypothetical protein